MNYLDLFSGIGGFALGAYWAGMRFQRHYFSEVDPFCVRLYGERFPDAIPLGDVGAITGSSLPSGEWIITGGFPCQDISFAGQGAGLDGERSGLWSQYARLISEIRPRYAIMENVAALAHRGLDRVVGDLAEAGYDSEWMPLFASDVGAPHQRERIWIVAYPNEELGETRNGSIKDGPRTLWEREDRKGVVSWTDEYRSLPRGVVAGLPYRVDRVGAGGNAIVPQIAEMIFRGLYTP